MAVKRLMMSERVRSIVQAVQALNADQRREPQLALANMDVPTQENAASRKELIESVRGKYSHVPTSSESFMTRKHDELELESKS